MGIYTDPPPTRDLGAAGRDSHTVFNRELIGVFLCVLDSHTNHYILCSMFYPGTEGELGSIPSTDPVTRAVSRVRGVTQP